MKNKRLRRLAKLLDLREPETLEVLLEKKINCLKESELWEKRYKASLEHFETLVRREGWDLTPGKLIESIRSRAALLYTGN